MLYQPKAADAFCGAGGFSLGLIKAGYDLVLGVDECPRALGVYRDNLAVPTARIDLASSHAIDAFLDALPCKIDLLAGSPPCQDYSPAGHVRDGFRAALTVRFAELVLAALPMDFVMENVPLAAKSRHFAQARKMLASKYRLAQAVVSATSHGIAQKRSRLVLVGHRRASPAAMQHALQSPSYSGQPRTVRDVLGTASPEHYFLHPAFCNMESSPSIHSADSPAPTILAQPNRKIRKNYSFKPGDSTTDLSVVRPLLVHEAAAIQTFPASYQWGTATDAQQWQMVGNAVPPDLAYILGRDLLGLPRKVPSPPLPTPKHLSAAEAAVLAAAFDGSPLVGKQAVIAQRLVAQGLLKPVLSFLPTESGRRAARAAAPGLAS